MFYNPEDTFLNEPEILGYFAELLESLGEEYRPYAERVKNALKKNKETEIMIDYAALFVGPYKLNAPPYGSVYIDKKRKLNSDSTKEVEELYKEYGLTVSKDISDTSDHIAVELEFLHTLLADYHNNPSQKTMDILNRFMESFFLPFVKGLSPLIISNASTDIYKCVGESLGMFTQNELTTLCCS